MIDKQQKNYIKNHKNTPQSIKKTFYNVKCTNEYSFTSSVLLNSRIQWQDEIFMHMSYMNYTYGLRFVIFCCTLRVVKFTHTSQGYFTASWAAMQLYWAGEGTLTIKG